MHQFLQQYLIDKIHSLQKTDKQTRFFVIFGNDDPRIYEPILQNIPATSPLHYVHQKTIAFHTVYVSGYSYIPPSPFHLKDWEKYDVSRFVDVGAVAPENGIHSIPRDKDSILGETIQQDLEQIVKHAPAEKTIFLFHSPPYNSMLDRGALDGKSVDYAPVDVHIGSIAIQRFIKKYQPFLTLHGHVHESTELTGHWKEKKGETYSFNAAHNGEELALIRFDTSDLNHATRELL